MSVEHMAHSRQSEMICEANKSMRQLLPYVHNQYQGEEDQGTLAMWGILASDLGQCPAYMKFMRSTGKSHALSHRSQGPEHTQDLQAWPGNSDTAPNHWQP